MQYTFPDTQPSLDDTIGWDHLDQTMNTITKKYYGFTLVMCPDCGCIVSRESDDELPCHNRGCGLSFRASDAPDLFF